MADVFIGLEIHIQLLTRSKVFCSCPADFGREPNTNVCPVCLGYPGVLPVLNREALQQAYMTGLALHCTMAQRALFDRKNYFYPDMAKNYQISQFSHPLGVNGWIEFDTQGERRRIRIHDIHLEEDAGKMIHTAEGAQLDYNRAGCSLLEIVTEPDFSSGREAEEFLQAFRTMVRFLGVCSGNMEEGSLRCDANVSVNHPGKGLGTKVEIKNLNSSRFVRKALEYEIRRQSRLLRTGRKIVQETRLWDEKRGRSESMRTKEEAHDYRYFPEPDLPPFWLDERFVQEAEDRMTELPLQVFDRYLREYQLPEDTARYLAEERSRCRFFEQTMEYYHHAKTAGSWIKEEPAAVGGPESGRVTPEHFAGLLKLCDEKAVTVQQAKEVLRLMGETGDAPEAIIEQEQLQGGVAEDELKAIIELVISRHPDTVKQIHDGNVKAVGFLMGKVMQESRGAADPLQAKAYLLEAMGISEAD